MADLVPHRLSPLHRRHISLGAQMVSEYGWQRPSRYTSAQEEGEEIASAAGLCDISPVGKLLVQGSEMPGVLMRALGVTKIPDTGRVTRQPGVGLLCRLAANQVLLFVPPRDADEVRSAFDAHQEGCVHVVDMTSGLTGLCLAGPRSQDVLSKLTDLDLSQPDAGDMTCAQTSLSGVQATVVRADLRSMSCYRIFVSRDLGEYAWDVLTEAGSREGLQPFGVETFRVLRGEA